MHTNPEHPALCDHTLSRGLALVPMSDDLQHSERSQRSQNPAEMAWVASGFPALWLQSSVLAGTYASSIVSPLPGTHSIGREHPQQARRAHSPSRYKHLHLARCEPGPPRSSRSLGSIQTFEQPHARSRTFQHTQSHSSHTPHHQSCTFAAVLWRVGGVKLACLTRAAPVLTISTDDNKRNVSGMWRRLAR